MHITYYLRTHWIDALAWSVILVCAVVTAKTVAPHVGLQPSGSSVYTPAWQPAFADATAPAPSPTPSPTPRPTITVTVTATAGQS